MAFQTSSMNQIFLSTFLFLHKNNCFTFVWNKYRRLLQLLHITVSIFTDLLGFQDINIE